MTLINGSPGYLIYGKVEDIAGNFTFGCSVIGYQVNAKKMKHIHALFHLLMLWCVTGVGAAGLRASTQPQQQRR